MLAFTALEPVHRAQPIGGQAAAALEPCRRFVGAAIRDAEKRSVVERARWEPAPDRRRILLEPLDTPFERVRGEVWYDVEGLPPGTANAHRDLPIVVDFRHFEPVLELRVDGERVRIQLASPPAPTAVLQWGADRVTVSASMVSDFPAAIHGSDGVARSVTPLPGVAGRPDRLLVAGSDVAEVYDAAGAPLDWRALPWHAELTSLRDGERRFAIADRVRAGAPVEVEGSPSGAVLLGDNGVRFRWRLSGKGESGPPGVWVHLLPVEGENTEDDDAADDPRAAFFGDGVTEVRVHQVRAPALTLRVIDSRRDSFELYLNARPPEGAVLELPNNLDTLRRQRDAVTLLAQSPRPHHRPLLRLLEDPDKVSWPPVVPATVSNWHLLTDDRLDGTGQQRDFVCRSLGTPDFAFLEGPPGSGKTHAICELVLQAIERGLTVALCSSTHAAVDNVLERLVDTFPQVRAIRIGKVERVDERVKKCQLDAQIDALCAAWAAAGQDVADPRLAAAALVVDSANLTAGTTTGILQHPLIRQGTAQARFDLMIIDESSKATFQEFLVPALYARRWIIVGDVRQLPPFTNIRDVEASLESLAVNERDFLSPAHQRALLVLRKLAYAPPSARIWVRETDEVLAAVQAELDAQSAIDGPAIRYVRVVGGRASTAQELAAADLATPEGLLRLQAADWVLASPSLGNGVEQWLPPELSPTTVTDDPVNPSSSLLARRRAAWLDGPGRHMAAVTTTMTGIQKSIRETTWSSEVAWRLARMHQLDRSKNAAARNRCRDEIRRLAPLAPSQARWFYDGLDALLDVGMRSVIESLQFGRQGSEFRRSSLSEGLSPREWGARAVLLRFQHRMDPAISDLPRELFYSDGDENNHALRDANTLQGRSAFWFGGFPKARVWRHVQGERTKGRNEAEVKAVRELLERFENACPGPRPDGRPWEVAVLSPYNGQVTALRGMLRSLTGRSRAETRFQWSNAEIFLSTVDRFQGREADLVILSMRNTDRLKTGHIDSPPRLNVAITRARRQFVIVGNQETYRRCEVDELRALAERSPRV
jgi:hypothetical protein